jgi:hypothetical protein
VNTDVDENLKRWNGMLEPKQIAWVKERSKRLGLRSESAVIRMLVQAAMDAEQAKQEAWTA